MNKRLLPIGFYDIGAEESKRSYIFTNRAIDNFLQNGYQLIKTSFIEFEEIYEKENLENVIKLIDPISKKNIFIRSDITIQISKYISLLNEEIVKPLKFCYFGDVLNAQTDELYCDRQQSQVGCEIIGDSGFDSYREVIKDTLKGLDGIEDLKIIITFPDLLDVVLASLNNINKEELRLAIINKNISDIKKYDAKNYGIISKIVLNNENFEEISNLVIKNFNNIYVDNLFNEANKLKKYLEINFNKVAIKFDLFGDYKFNYHHKIAFDIFCGNYRYPIAKGGCYSIKSKDFKVIKATGSTIYVNHLTKF